MVLFSRIYSEHTHTHTHTKFTRRLSKISSVIHNHDWNSKSKRRLHNVDGMWEQMSNQISGVYPCCCGFWKHCGIFCGLSAAARSLVPSRQVFRQRSFLFLQSGCRRFGRERQRKRAKRKGRTDGRTAEQCFHKGRNDVGRLHFQVAKVGKLGPDGNIFIVLHI